MLKPNAKALYIETPSNPMMQPHHIFLPANPALAVLPYLEFLKQTDRSGYSQLNALELAACQAAYTSGGPWLEQCSNWKRQFLAGKTKKAEMPLCALMQRGGSRNCQNFYFAY